MSRITDKSIRPQPLPGEAERRQEQPASPTPSLPPGARVVGTALTPSQRVENQRLIALYHLLKEDSTAKRASDEHQAKLKGWKKRQGGRKRRGLAGSGNQAEPDEKQGGE